MANEDNEKKLDDLFKQQDELFGELTKIYKEQDALWEILTKDAKDIDGDGIVDVDQSRPEYKEIQKLDKQVEELWKQVEINDVEIAELSDFASEGEAMATSFILDMNIVEGTDGDDELSGTDKNDDISGKAGNDKLSGGDEFDFLNGGEGNDELNGDAGDDNLDGGEGDDKLNGGDGNDYLVGGKGNDTMAGGDGGDHFSFSGDSGHDVITDFNPEEDTIDLWAEGVEFKDLKSEQTSDGLKVSWGDNSVLLQGVTVELSEKWFHVGGFWIEPLPGEFIEGTDGDDDLKGGDGWDFLDGGAGNDTLSGEEEGDTVYGGEGNDVMNGGDGYDHMDGGSGNDTMTGGEGGDHYTFYGDSGDDVITDFNPENDTLSIIYEGLSFDDVKTEQTSDGLKLSWGEGNSVLLKGFTGEASDTWLWVDDGVIVIDPLPVEPGEFLDGTDGDDVLEGGDGWDYLFGGKGNDKLSGGKEGDSLYGGEGNDTMDGGDGFDYLDGGEGNDSMTGGEGADHYSFYKDSGDDVITDFDPKEDTISAMAEGLKFEDVKSEQTSDGLKITWGENSLLLKGVTAELSEDWFWANDGAIIEPGLPGSYINVVHGEDGNDTLTGGDGYDDLYGGKGDDVLDGGKDVDYLFGEEGNDTMTGGENVDIFFFSENAGNDTITDFTPGEDLLDLTGVGVEFEDITSKQENGGTTVSWSDGSVFLAGVTDDLSEDWFALGRGGDVVAFDTTTISGG